MWTIQLGKIHETIFWIHQNIRMKNCSRQFGHISNRSACTNSINWYWSEMELYVLIITVKSIDLRDATCLHEKMHWFPLHFLLFCSYAHSQSILTKCTFKLIVSIVCLWKVFFENKRFYIFLSCRATSEKYNKSSNIHNLYAFEDISNEYQTFVQVITDHMALNISKTFLRYAASKISSLACYMGQPKNILMKIYEHLHWRYTSIALVHITT